VRTRSIVIDDPFDLTIEQKIFLTAKRLCILFAGGALTLAALDLMHEHPVVNVQSAQIDALAHVIGAGIATFTLVSGPSSVIVAIPAGDIAPADQPAAARQQYAVAVAMPAQRPVPAVAAPAADIEAFKLASLTPPGLQRPMANAPVLSLPSLISVLPVHPPPLSPAQRLHLQGASRAKAEACLAKAVYFEARDQPFRGQVAVAQVVINRVFSPFYPDDLCGVIYQNADRLLACQFTFACDGRSKAIKEHAAWARARRIARETLDGKLYVQAVGTATHYHAVYVRPNWVREMHRIVREGSHIFYRPVAWGSGADLPIWSSAELAVNNRKR
jgi:hypothetical protein